MTREGSNFIREIAEAYAALEREPERIAELSRMASECERLRETIQHRELRIIDLKVEVEDAQTKARKAEADRDDAELRFLEADDKLDKLRRLVQAFSMDAALLCQPEPKPVSVPLPDTTIDQSASSPPSPVTPPSIGSTDMDGESGEVKPATYFDYDNTGESHPTSQPSTTDSELQTRSGTVLGERVADPTASKETTPSPIVEFGTAESSAPVSSPASVEQPSAGPYHGKKYAEWPYFVSLQGWLNGGGTEEDYTWNPPAVSSASHYS